MEIHDWIVGTETPTSFDKLFAENNCPILPAHNFTNLVNNLRSFI
jgi:hypothetical protein